MTAVLPSQRHGTAGDPSASWALLDRAKNGDADAVAALYERYQPGLLAFIHHRLIGQEQTAQDLAHDVWVRALRGMDRVSYVGSDVMAWLVTIARNLVIDHYKSGRVRLMVCTPTEPGGPFDQDPADHGDGADTPVIVGSVREAVRAALTRLTPDQARCVQLRYLDGLSLRETAQLLGVEEGAVKASCYRAMRRLAGDRTLQEVR